MDLMRRGEIWWVDFDPSVGGEIRKVRPAIIISNNAANSALNRIQVVPLTSNTDRLYPSEARVSIDGTLSKAMADQLATVSKLRFKTKLAIISKDEMLEVEKALKLQLGLKL